MASDRVTLVPDEEAIAEMRAAAERPHADPARLEALMAEFHALDAKWAAEWPRVVRGGWRVASPCRPRLTRARASRRTARGRVTRTAPSRASPSSSDEPSPCPRARRGSGVSPWRETP
jgi:hypothetical protein